MVGRLRPGPRSAGRAPEPPPDYAPASAASRARSAQPATDRRIVLTPVPSSWRRPGGGTGRRRRRRGRTAKAGLADELEPADVVDEPGHSLLPTPIAARSARAPPQERRMGTRCAPSPAWHASVVERGGRSTTPFPRPLSERCSATTAAGVGVGTRCSTTTDGGAGEGTRCSTTPDPRAPLPGTACASNRALSRGGARSSRGAARRASRGRAGCSCSPSCAVTEPRLPTPEPV